MAIAVDSPVLIELLSNGPQADAVEACLRQSLVGGRVVVCGTTLAELCAALQGGAEVLEALEEMGVHFSALEAKSALRAGEMHRRHRQRRGGRRCLDGFMVGAHALLQCDGLITWNDTFYRDYFKGLKLIVPQA
ncbi:type II toxin-antitoxin system VapC family toxin [[Pseudomonas] boreopolis]|uniref:type II toxin-antitoxin system VapC family toxin n=1 Tax=Xanthomonas boreopolis TaxID=86183 RepID=UPI003D9BB9A7